MAPGDGSDGSIVDSGATGSTGSTGSPASSGSTGATATGSPTPTPKWEDDPRAKGVLEDLRKERAARQRYATDLATHAATLAERDRQIAALTNSKLPSKEEAEEDAVRKAIESMYPALKNLTPEALQKVLAVADRGEEFEKYTVQQATKHGRSMLDQAYKGVEEHLGTLTDRQKKKIAAAYVAEAEADPKFLERHDAGDPRVIEEFVKGYVEDFVEPARRKVTSTEVNRQRQVPFGKDRSLPSSGGKTIDVNDPKAVEDFLVQSYKDKGGAFTGRR